MNKGELEWRRVKGVRWDWLGGGELPSEGDEELMRVRARGGRRVNEGGREAIWHPTQGFGCWLAAGS